MCLYLCREACNVVAAGLCFADAAADCTYIVVFDPNLYRVKAALIVSADRGKNDDEFIGVRRAYAEERIRCNDERTNIKRSAGTARNPICVNGDERLDRIEEIIGRDLRDAKSSVGVVCTLDVLVRAEQTNAAVCAFISLHALEHFLAVVENHSGRIKDDRLIRHDLRIVPTLLRVIFHHIHVICKDFTETELAFVCRLRFRRSGTLNLDFLHQKTLLSCLLIHILARICFFCKLPRFKLQKKLHK